MTLSDMQQVFLEKLQEIFPAPDYRVQDFPDDPAGYQFAHAGPAVLLVFSERSYDPPRSTDGHFQPNRPVFQVAFLSRQLRSKTDVSGAYQLLDTARGELQGFMIGESPVWIRREYFQTLKPGGVWIFGQDWTFDAETDEGL
jgi:hypothetical protein